MHTRISNKIPKYSHVSVPTLIDQKSPAEQWFLGGGFALSVSDIGKLAGLLYCLRVSALFVLRFFYLVFDNWFGRSIGVRCFLRLRTWSPTWPPALSRTWSRSWSPTFTSAWHWLAGLAPIFRCEPALLHTRARSAHTSGTKLSLPSIHSPALGCYASALAASATPALHCHASAWEASAASTLHCHASALEASTASTLHCRASALETSAASTLHSRASALETSAVSTLHSHTSALATSTASALAAPDVLNRTLAVRTVWASGSPEIVRPYGFGVCTHSWSAGHSASPSRFAAATAAASARTGKRLTGQNRYCQHNKDCCFDSCLFHFRFLSLMFRFTAFLSPLLGSFYRDSGAGGKKVTPGVKFSGKNIRSYIFLHPCSDCRVNLV